MKIILLGSTGKLGRAFAKYFSLNEQSFLSLNSKNFDAKKPDDSLDIFIKFKPDLVINCIALNGLDKNFLNPENAFLINSHLPLWLAKKSVELNYTLVHFSTDSIFNDNQNISYIEDDIPAPRSVYGITKLAGELFLKANAEKYYLIRLPLLFGADLASNQLIEKLIAKTINQENVWLNSKLKIIPTFIHDIPPEFFKTILGSKCGTYHLMNEGEVLLTQFIDKIVNCMGLTYISSDSPSDEVRSLDIKEFNIVLNTNKISKMRHHDLAIMDYVKLLNS